MEGSTKKFLIVQTAFIGDVILATSLIEKLSATYPDSDVDFLLRKGNEDLLHGHPLLRNIIVLDKSRNKFASLYRVIRNIQKERYDVVVNVQRFFTTGIITAFSKGTEKIGFSKNPLSAFFSRKIAHEIDPETGTHEIERNQKLIAHLTDDVVAMPRLYPSGKDYQQVAQFKNERYICIAPASVWFTKQFPSEKWVEFISTLPEDMRINLIGGPSDREICETIVGQSQHPKLRILVGELTLLQSAALMEGAIMNYVNDSAPLHLASAVNAPTCVVFCSTLPGFGFRPLSENSIIVETSEKLSCRPCGLHGKKSCPEGHFNCAHGIAVNNLHNALPNIEEN